MLKRQSSIGWIYRMYPADRWIGFEPITSAVKEQFLFAIKIPGQDLFLRALPVELPPVMNAASCPSETPSYGPPGIRTLI